MVVVLIINFMDVDILLGSSQNIWPRREFLYNFR